MEGLSRYKEIQCKYLPNSWSSRIIKDRSENFLWRAPNLQDMAYLKNVVIFCGTKHLCNDFPYDISKIKILKSRILPRVAQLIGH